MKRAGSISTEMARAASLTVAFAVALFAAVAASADDTRIIQLRNRTAAEMLPIVSPLLGPNDAISGTDYRLIVRTSDKNFQEIQKLLSQLDTARRQFRIQVKQSVAENRDSSHVGVSGEYRNDNVRIRLPRQSPQSSGAIIRRNGVQIETHQTRTTSNNSSTQFISTLDGVPAFVRVGQSYPQVQRILAITGKQQIVLAQGVSVHNIVTGFDVIPHAQGDKVLVQITPRLSSLSNPTVGIANFQEFSTTVIAKPGEWIDIGGITGTGQDVRRAILDSSSNETGEQRTVLLKVD